jgi:uncharacterized protein YjiS (DUF1127 family)
MRHVHAESTLAHALQRVRAWRARRRERRQLLGLGDAALKDLGLSRIDAWQEASKPFWRP